MGSASSIRPRLRADLLTSEQRQADGTFFVFKDPATRRFFRFKEPEYFVARQFDGSSSLEAVRQRTREKFGSDLSEEALEQFAATLRRLGLLEGEGPAVAASPARAPRVRGTLLYLRFRAFDPDRLLARLEPKVHIFFRPGFLVLSAAAILLGLAITLLNRAEIQRDLRGLWRFDALLFAWLTVLLVTAVHEFAHGLTCKHFGGAVHEMGFMLIYFQPAFYCNVSDAWLFPQKSRRLWVTFSGAYVEIFIWALATLTWRLTPPDTWISFVALVVMATSAIKTLVNLNPLIKLDGYYLLSDYLEIPNLRQKSVGYLRALLGRLFRRAAEGTTALSRRERRIFLIYGLLAGGYSFWLLGYVALQFGRFLTERYHGMGFILFGGFLVILLGNPLTKLRKGAASTFQAARARARTKVPVKALLAAGALVAVLVFGRWELKVSGAFLALPLHNADVEAEVEGFVEEVRVHEGEWVDRGHVIAVLSNPDLLAQREKIEAELQEKQAALRMLAAGTRTEEIEVARRQLETTHSRLAESRRRHQDARQMRAEKISRAESVVQKARARLEYGGKELKRSEALLAEGLLSRQQFETIEEQVAVRGSELGQAEAELRELRSDELSEFQKELAIATREAGEADARVQLLLAGPRQEEMDVARAELAGFEAQKRHLDGQLRLLTVLSPSPGIVTTPSLQLQDKVGHFVGKGELIAEVHELQTVTAEIAVAEKDIGEVSLGQKVVVRARAYPGRTFEGTVVSIAAAATRPEAATTLTAPREQSFLVTTEIDNHSRLLKPGMSGHAKIDCGRRRILDLLTRSVASYVRVEFWSWW